MCQVCQLWKWLLLYVVPYFRLGEKCGTPIYLSWKLNLLSYFCLLILLKDFTLQFQEKEYGFRNKEGCKVPFHISNWKYCPTVSKTWVGTVLPILHINITYMHQTKIFEFRSYHMLYPYLQKNLFISWFNWLRSQIFILEMSQYQKYWWYCQGTYISK